MEASQEGQLPSPKDPDETLGYTTSSGCLLVFDDESDVLLVFGAEGSELALTLADLKEIAFEFRHHPSFERLRSLLLCGS